MVERDRYAHKQLCVYTIFCKDFIDIRAVAREVSCKPNNTPLLSIEFGTDSFANGYTPHTDECGLQVKKIFSALYVMFNKGLTLTTHKPQKKETRYFRVLASQGVWHNLTAE